MAEADPNIYLQGTRYRVPGLESELLGLARSDNRGDKPPVLFVHGAFSRGKIWEFEFLDYFASAGFPSFSFDLRGRKSSPFALIQPGLDEYAKDIEQAIQALSEPPIVVAHSMGGFVAQKLIGKVPMRALVLMGTVPPLGVATSNMMMAMQYPFLWMNTALFAVNPAMGDLTAASGALFSALVEKERARTFLRSSVSESPRALLELQMPATIASARSKDVPALVIGGAEDKLIPIDEQERAAAYHNAPFIQIDQLGHAMMADARWKVCAQAIENWLREDVIG
ncbi:MAG: alpha/beta hydrolase [Pseudomonadota bacterium]